MCSSYSMRVTRRFMHVTRCFMRVTSRFVLVNRRFTRITPFHVHHTSFHARHSVVSCASLVSCTPHVVSCLSCVVSYASLIVSCSSHVVSCSSRRHFRLVDLDKDADLTPKSAAVKRSLAPPSGPGVVPKKKDGRGRPRKDRSLVDPHAVAATAAQAPAAAVSAGQFLFVIY